MEEQSDPILVRRQKLEQWRAAGVDPFAGERYERTHSARAAGESFDALQGQTVSLAGRITSQRPMGKATFLDLTDESGRIQLYFKRDRLGDDRYALTRLFDLGDFLGVKGELFRTRTGEITVDVAEFTPLAKALRPLPLPKEEEGKEYVRSGGRRAALPPALRRPGCPSHGARAFPPPQPHCHRHPPLPRCPRLSGGRDAGPPGGRGRRGGEAVPDAS